jgi:hypothetical protein
METLNDEPRFVGRNHRTRPVKLLYVEGTGLGASRSVCNLIEER